MSKVITFLLLVLLTVAKASDARPIVNYLDSNKILQNNYKALQLSFDSLFKFIEINCKGYVNLKGELIHGSNKQCQYLKKLKGHIKAQNELNTYFGTDSGLFEEGANANIILKPEFLRSGYWTLSASLSESQKNEIIVKLFKWTFDKKKLLQDIDKLHKSLIDIRVKNDVIEHMLLLIKVWFYDSYDLETQLFYFRNTTCQKCTSQNSAFGTMATTLISYKEKIISTLEAIKKFKSTDIKKMTQIKSFLLLEYSFNSLSNLSPAEIESLINNEEYLKDWAYTHLLNLNSDMRYLWSPKDNQHVFVNTVRLSNLLILISELENSLPSSFTTHKELEKETQKELESLINSVDQYLLDSTRI